ncbi:PE-PPE domain-containing protein [Gordonia sp. (in: high G+C Gram-positive bacteria)]|uniref:cutinase family protein n=1 Tax=Gordonia sp. (in: high G+C Gram-positive bacteria) TaxID=84139 RepID=UPI00333E6054
MKIRRPGILVPLAAGLLLPLLPTNVGITSAAPNCPRVMEFSTGGAAQPDGIRLGAMGKSVPADTQRTKVRYSASISPVGGNISGAESTAEGERNLRGAARSFRARCPGSHIRLVGFSQGALVTGNVCNTFDSDPVMSRNTSCVLYSDPRRPDPVRPGVMAMLPSFVPGFPMMGPRPQTRNIPVTQVCQTNDGICAAPNPVLDPIGFINNLLGYLVYGAHGDYFAAPHTVDDGRLHTVRRAPYIPTADVPRPAPGLPTPYDVFDPVNRLLITPAPIATTYRPTPLAAYFPPIVAWVLPPRIGAVVLPPIVDLQAILVAVVEVVDAVVGTVADVVDAIVVPEVGAAEQVPLPPVVVPDVQDAELAPGLSAPLVPGGGAETVLPRVSEVASNVFGPTAGDGADIDRMAALVGAPVAGLPIDPAFTVPVEAPLADA